MKKKAIAASVILSGGIIAGSFLPEKTNASSNLVIASVEWVTSQLNPLKSKIQTLENQVGQQEKEIAALRKELEAIQDGSGNDNNDNTDSPSVSVPSYVYAKGTVTIHKGATKDYDVVAQKPKGSKLKVIDSFTSKSGLWYRVEITSSLKGWVYSGDVSSSTVANPTKVTTTASVKVRKGATTSYSVVATVSSGTTLKYIQSFTNTAGETWYNVETSNGTRGWMLSTYGEVK